jgi:hypothetical protein
MFFKDTRGKPFVYKRFPLRALTKNFNVLIFSSK